MARIAIYVGRHLCTAPRPCKEADALAAAGHIVTVHGLWSDPRLVARDEALLANRVWKFTPYADCRPDTLHRRWRWWRVRARNRLARELFVRTGRITADIFGYGTAALAAHAKNSTADLALFHSEGGLWTARQLHRAGRRVGMDFEDWFSRDLPPAKHTGRPLAALAQLESAALRFGPYVLATSHAMADALANAYAGPKPAVIYNTFPIADAPPARTAAIDPRRISLHWFSLFLGPDRGLETLFAALPALQENWELHLRADDPGHYAAHLTASLPERLRSRVHFSPTVSNAELPARIAGHDIGLALDVSHIPSRNLTVTNKLFQYLQAGLAVVASDTAGHAEILEQARDAGELFTAGDSVALTAALQRFCSDPVRLVAAKQAARRAGETIFAHERQAPLYADLADRALRSA
ncbi:glycosyltransferase [Horticoccus luteus]|uniref:Glycosyltransferase n=1 Tax=Horticoccus luteus TaxID=2862869 RepID=A0A8F9XLA0_9BACT|nr:glycosyltransferase [Horticoccus luteus]QYM80483.1 glycosyltransferase [Horticoccus luteus]